jgi:hypothetical protein
MGLFQKIEQEPFEKCIYKKIFLDYTYGLNKIYTKEEIDKARMSPSFEREYCLKYQGLIGNVFSKSDLAYCYKQCIDGIEEVRRKTWTMKKSMSNSERCDIPRNEERTKANNLDV